MTRYAIETQRLTKRFDDTLAVDRLDLEVEAGSFFSLLGRNGAGKSTTIGMLTGTLRPTDGKAFLLGRPLDPDDPWFKSRVGVVSEEPPLFSRLTAQEQLVFAGRMFGLDPKEATRRARVSLDLLKLSKASKALICDFSRGMKKKLAIGCALIHAPKLLFLDEPFEGVDATSAATIREVLKGLAASGATILLTTHILEVAQRLCDRVAILHDGELAYKSTMKKLLEGGETLEEVFSRVSGSREEAKEVMPDWLVAPHGEETEDKAPPCS